MACNISLFLPGRSTSQVATDYDINSLLIDEMARLILNTASHTAHRVNHPRSFSRLCLEICFLYIHLLSRLLFKEFGLFFRDSFMPYLFISVLDQLPPFWLEGRNRQHLIKEMNAREAYYCRYPGLEDQSCDVSWICRAFSAYINEQMPDNQISLSATLLVNDSCIKLVRRLKSMRYRLSAWETRANSV